MPGLGENTPIKLQLSKENLNALISRHSQPIRWLSADKCPCIGENRKVDENCPICHGNGITYEAVTESNRVETVKAILDGIIEVGDVEWIRDFYGNDYPITESNCVTYATGLKKGYSYQVKYKEDIIESGSGTATLIGGTLYSINIPNQIDFGTVQGDLVSVTATSEGSELTVSNIFRNCFEISEEVSTDVSVEYTYVNPFQFALITNNFSKSDQKYLDAISGQGILIFPQRWHVNQEDIIVALNATETKKTVVRSTGDIDTLPSFYLNQLERAYSIRDEAKHYYEPYIDFIIYNGNQIKWVTNNKPEENEAYSITYIYNTVFKVIGDIPDPRTSENNRFPRKVAIKLYTDFNKRDDI